MLQYLIPTFAMIALATTCSSKIAEKLELTPADKMVAAHAEKQKRYGLALVKAVTPNPEEIDYFSLHYLAFKEYDIRRVRKLFVLSVEEFLHLTNNNLELRPKLKKYPLTANDLSLSLTFATEDGQFWEYPSVAYAYLDEGTIHYCYRDAMFADFIENSEVTESYEEAIKTCE